MGTVSRAHYRPLMGAKDSNCQGNAMVDRISLKVSLGLLDQAFGPLGLHLLENAIGNLRPR